MSTKKKVRRKRQVTSTDPLIANQINKILDIDITRLDEECLQQPKLFLKQAEAYTEAEQAVTECRMILDEKKSQLKEVEAEMKLRIRKNPSKFKLEKSTDASVADAVLNTMKFKQALLVFQKATNDFNKALVHSMKMKDLKDATWQRKEMLENLVKLHGQEYFSTPRVTYKSRTQRKMQGE